MNLIGRLSIAVSYTHLDVYESTTLHRFTIKTDEFDRTPIYSDSFIHI
uniref:Uncharacterized protein n=1 Tax=Candidatus Enterococcus clewellii TaxID=1834193 RepID=A0A242JYQ9_9ENTE|nr:hypothetical protein A5888_004029 [Enterococcus sp. 9E7_DIV0242]